MQRFIKSLLSFSLSLLVGLGLYLWILPGNSIFQNIFVQNPEANNKIANPNSYSCYPSPTETIRVATLQFPTKTITPTKNITATHTPTVSPTPSSGESLIIGHSVEGRPLEVYRFGQGEHVLLIIAGVHGGYEWNTVALADQLIDQVKAQPDLIPVDKTLFILRVLNPDGYARNKGADGRANANNVDINRNWDANWQEKWKGTQCWQQRVITAGTSPGSEPETQALINFIKAYKVERIINYHSASLGIFAGGLSNNQDSKDLAYSLALVSPYSYPPLQTDCQFTGQLTDWASAQGIPAVDIELTNHTDTDFEINLEILKIFVVWEPAN